ncbi:flagellar hook-basal body complex protein FliE [Alkalibacterium subtropicum]|uniref:Flagellar hook-basal body complex protein FliE n=1 Tax=Alkalibacterium subtropicum TaxID=753702 RepID=A0A1I1IV04_9LACT|nr:flagellar hook-basal body complex protein FliE [Alkalibacterium subtropicum]SFC40107.1 flagellar hook-basal body complex protein FliE [Alkalibacterium subtropicum]
MINPLNQLYPNALQQIDQVAQTTSRVTDKQADSFTDLLNQSINNLDSKQSESTQAIQSLVDGTADDLHTVMIKTTEAQLSLEVAVQLRNRSLEAFNELKNMQF